MSYPHPPTGVTHGGVVGLGGSAALPPPPRRRDGKGFRRGLSVAIVIAVCLAVVIVGAVGVYAYSRLTSSTSGQREAPPAQVLSAPTAEQVRAATVDLCTRFAAGYRAMPAPQNTGFDLIPTINYIAHALRDDSIADGAIRQAVAKSLLGLRDHAMLLSGEANHGAIQNPKNWSVDTAAHADQRVWDLCRAYGD